MKSSAKRAFAANAGAAELARLHRDLLAIFEAEAGQPWPEDPAVQLEAAARAMARRWNAPSARLLRAARGAPEAAGLGLVVQELALALGPGASGAGYLQLVDSRTGAGAESGGFRPQRQRGEAGTAGQGGPRRPAGRRRATHCRRRPGGRPWGSATRCALISLWKTTAPRSSAWPRSAAPGERR